MESCGSRKPKPLLPAVLCLAVLLLLLLLLLPLQPASAVPTSRSMQLRSQQQHQPSLKLSSLQEMVAAAGKLQGRAAARMTVEVNDYPGSGPNNRHDPPKGPGRG